MTLLHRLKNLWRLSGMDIDKTIYSTDNPFIQGIVNGSKPIKPAQIIKMSDPIKKVIEEEPNL